MIKYIYSTGIGVFLSLLSNGQASSFTVDTSETGLKGKEFIVSLVDPNPFNLPKEGVVEAFASDIILYSGRVKHHRLQGSWQSWYSNGKLCDSGYFVKGMPDGEWKHWDANGQLLAIRNYNADKLMRVKDEVRHGNPRNSAYPLVRLYRKNDRDGKRYIGAAYSFGNTDNYVPVSLRDAVENNVTAGMTYRPVFNECLHHGLYMNFYSNGQVKDSGYYKNGLRDGIWIHRDTNGSYSMGTYKQGLRYNEWKQYDRDGRLLSMIVYNRKGEEVWGKKFRN